MGIEVVELRGESIQDVLSRAAARANECDHIVVIMQKKDGGVLYFAKDVMRIETIVWMAESVAFALRAAAYGLIGR